MQRHLIPFITSFYAARVEEVVHLMDMIVSDQASLDLSEPLTMSQLHVAYLFSNDKLGITALGKFSREEGRSKMLVEMIDWGYSLLI